MTARVSLVGKRFGRLLVLRQSYARDPQGRMRAYCECRCDCGATKSVAADNLKGSKVSSCGCLVAERQHRMSFTPEYRAWHNIVGRCTNPNDRSWRNYGGRGIRVCSEWRHDFRAFNAHVGPRPSSRHSIDRIDNSKGYEPGNVRWATWSVQARNRRTNRILSHAGLTLPLVDWAARLGIAPKTLSRRFQHGWSVERALTEPYRREYARR